MTVWFVIYAGFFVAAAWLFAFMFLRGSSMQAFDEPIQKNTDTAPSAEHDWALQRLAEIRRAVNEQDTGNLLQRARAAVDLLGEDADLTDISITPVDLTLQEGPLRGEWVVHSQSAADKRLLYIHGGAFVVGSPRSHRTVTTRLARDLGVSVFAVDYRMMPEHRRMLGVQDCQNAYTWLQSNGPDASGQASKLVIAGDSAGGNLTLMMLAWASRAPVMTPAAGVALSPLTDSTFDSPTWRENKATDHMFGAEPGAAARPAPLAAAVPDLVHQPGTAIGPAGISVTRRSQRTPANPVARQPGGDAAGGCGALCESMQSRRFKRTVADLAPHDSRLAPVPAPAAGSEPGVRGHPAVPDAASGNRLTAWSRSAPVPGFRRTPGSTSCVRSASPRQD